MVKAAAAKKAINTYVKDIAKNGSTMTWQDVNGGKMATFTSQNGKITYNIFDKPREYRNEFGQIVNTRTITYQVGDKSYRLYDDDSDGNFDTVIINYEGKDYYEQYIDRNDDGNFDIKMRHDNK